MALSRAVHQNIMAVVRRIREASKKSEEAGEIHKMREAVHRTTLLSFYRRVVR